MKKNRKFDIIYEDRDIIVIDKPAGMLSISTDKREENTAYRFVNDYMRSKRGRVFIVHRLDRETSGVMLFAKSEKVKLKLQDNWDNTAIKRGYIAIVEGRVTIPERRITSWLKQTKSLQVYSGNREGDGKLAITNYKVLRVSGKYSLLELSLETGRKNQIRVHMKDIGHSVVGDKKYGATANPLNRLGLHASVLTVKQPTSGEEMQFKSETPQIFTKLFKGENNPPATVNNKG
ncbi:MAG: RNA pseudouridine synthase [Oscillospiraceae bacterium]|nr:RNA pseudouridine synthase [Oscillospiraceae bacterium]